MKNKSIAIALLVVGAIALGYLSYRTVSYLNLLIRRRVEWNVLRNNVNTQVAAFKGTAYVVIEDMRKGWRIGFAEDERLPSASLVKVPIMASCFYAAYRGTIDLEEEIPLQARHKAGGSGNLEHKPNGTRLKVRELIEVMIVESDNTATNVLIDHLGFDYLNTRFRKFGLRDTNISRMMMDMQSRSRGIENYTTARDMALLLKRIYTGRLINKAISFTCLDILMRQKSRDRIPARLPADTVVAHKTGLEKGICHDAGIIFTDNGDLLMCVLTRHRNRSARSAKRFIATLAHQGYDYMMKR